MYRALLKSVLEHGLSPTVEDDRGRNALFVLCEQMSMVSSDQSPDSTRLMGIVLDACGSSGVGGSDRTGRTVFDIEERVAQSCLSACRQMLLDAGGTHRVRSSTNNKPASNYASSGASVASHRSSSSVRNNNDWEFEKPRPGSAPGFNGVSSSGSSYRFSATGAEEGKRRVSSSSSSNVSYAIQRDSHNRSSTSASAASSDDQYRRRPSSSTSANGGSSSSYFDDVEGEEVDSRRSTSGRATQKLPPFSSYTPNLHKNGGVLR